MDNKRIKMPDDTPIITGKCLLGIRQLPIIQGRSIGGINVDPSWNSPSNRHKIKSKHNSIYNKMRMMIIIARTSFWSWAIKVTDSSKSFTRCPSVRLSWPALENIHDELKSANQNVGISISCVGICRVNVAVGFVPATGTRNVTLSNIK